MKFLQNIFSMFGSYSKSKNRRTRHKKRSNKKHTRRVRKMKGG